MNRPPTLATKTLMYTVLVIMTLFAFYPVWFSILASGRAGDRLYTFNLAGMFIPTEWTFENYRSLLYETQFLTWIKKRFNASLWFKIVVICYLMYYGLFSVAAIKFYGLRFDNGDTTSPMALFAVIYFPLVLALLSHYWHKFSFKLEAGMTPMPDGCHAAAGHETLETGMWSDLAPTVKGISANRLPLLIGAL